MPPCCSTSSHQLDVPLTAVARAALVRVLAVAQLLAGALEREVQMSGERPRRRANQATIAASYAAVCANALRASARRVSSLTVPSLASQLVEHGVVVDGSVTMRDVGVVLRRGPDHRRAADVDGLDAGVAAANG